MSAPRCSGGRTAASWEGAAKVPELEVPERASRRGRAGEGENVRDSRCSEADLPASSRQQRPVR